MSPVVVGIVGFSSALAGASVLLWGVTTDAAGARIARTPKYTPASTNTMAATSAGTSHGFCTAGGAAAARPCGDRLSFVGASQS